MPRSITPSERAILIAWASQDGSPHQQIARRAHCLLEHGRGRTPVAPYGLSEDRVLDIQSAFDQMGLLALVDAPRSGRPLKGASGALRGAVIQSNEIDTGLVAGIGSPGSKDAKWRMGRISGLSFDRSRHITAIHLPRPGTEGALAAVYLAQGVWLEVTRSGTRPQTGKWYHPHRLARREAILAQTSGGGKLPLISLSAALISHLKTPGPARPRGEQEKIAFWCAGVARLAQACPVKIRLSAQPDATVLLRILKELRRNHLWQGDSGILNGFALVDAKTWQEGFRQHLGTSVGPILRPGDAAFAWCV